jgi:hypothetical protein
MDPNANLNEQIEIAQRAVEYDANSSPSAVARDLNRLSELVLALDDWLRRGGFVPRRWEWWKDKEGGVKR